MIIEFEKRDYSKFKGVPIKKEFPSSYQFFSYGVYPNAFKE